MLSTEGSVFVTDDEGRTWKPPNGLDGKRIMRVRLTPDGRRGIAGSTMSSVFFTTDGGMTWSLPTDLTEKGFKPEEKGSEPERVAVVEFGGNGDSETLLVVGHEGSAFVTRYEDLNWKSPEGLNLNKSIGETIIKMSFAPGRRRGIAGSNESAVFFTTDGGWTWTRTEGFDSATKELVSVRAIQEKPTKEISVDRPTRAKSPSEEKDGSQYSFLMMAGDGAYILKTHQIGPEESLSVIQSRVRNDDVLRRSVIGKDILKMSLQESPGLEGNHGEDTTKIWFPIDELTLMRIATMTIVFFLVQLLVRLYQYNLRLASFLDSRADAVLLARTFASRERIPFDDLVRSMARRL